MINLKSKKALIIIGIIAVLVLILIGTLIWYFVSISSVSKNEEEIEVVIPLGSGTSKIASILKENNLIRSETAFKIYVKINNVSDFQAGTYYLKQSMSVKEITNMLKTGIMYDPNEMTLTYIEGKNIRWLAELIEQKTNNTAEDVFELLSNEEYIDSLIDKYWFLTEDIKNDNIYYPLEGYLFPDTYALQNRDVEVSEIFEKMLDRMEEILDNYREDIENSEYSIHEILTIASIVELETTHDEDRKNVASVICNRLENNMAIQSDPTTYYAFNITIGERDLYQEEIDTYNPYNTRGPNMEGKIPVGPMSSVGRSSIEAALYPNDTDYLFFVSDKNSKLYFTRTNDEHNQIINELREEGLWLEYE